MARVLVVEPDRQIRQFIAGILTDFGHQVRPCRDRAEARDCLRRQDFDAVATDLPLDAEVKARQLSLSGHRCSRERRPQCLRDKPFRFADLHRLVAAVAATAAVPNCRFAA